MKKKKNTNRSRYVKTHRRAQDAILGKPEICFIWIKTTLKL